MKTMPSLKADRRSLILVVCSVLVVALFALLSFTSYQQMRAQRQEQMRSEAQHMLLALEANTIRLFDYADGYLHSIRAFYAGHGISKEWQDFAHEVQVPDSKLFSGVFAIIDRDGESVYQSATPQPMLKSYGNMSKLDHFQYFREHPGDTIFIGATRLGKVTGKLQFRIARPILKNGVFDGLVYISLPPEHMTDLFRSISLGPNSSVVVLTMEPKLIARQPPPSPASYDHVLPDLKNTYGIDIAQSSAGSSFNIGSPFDDLRRDVFYKRLSEYPVTIVVSIAEKDLDDAMASTRRNMSALTASFALISFAVTLLLLRLSEQNRRLIEIDAKLRESAAIVDSSNIAILSKNLDGIIKSWNRGAERTFGYLAVEIVGQSMQILIPQDRLDEEREILTRIAQGEKVEHFETLRQHKNGTMIDISITISPVRNVNGKIIGASTIAQDITERKRLEAKQKVAQRLLEAQLAEISALQVLLKEQVIRDPLTGLCNRRFLDETLPRELARAKREGYILALIMIDLDHFKHVNDTYGHAAGDSVLKVLSSILLDGARESDMICRYGGEEFLVALPRMPQNQALQRVEAWRKELDETTITYGDFNIHVTLSAGVAVFPRDGADLDTLVIHADEALYCSKHEGRNRVTCCQSSG